MGHGMIFFEIAEKTTKVDEGIFGYIIRGGSGGAEALEKLMYSYSGITEYFDDGTCTLNDPKMWNLWKNILEDIRKSALQMT